MRAYQDQRIIGINRLTLKQARFKRGALYLSEIAIGGIIDSIDVRYFGEAENILTPTRQGFRVHQNSFRMLEEFLKNFDTNSAHSVLWESAQRKLIARYCNDEYGQAMDFRYFKKSPDYQGWEPRGIRLQIEDYEKFREQLLNTQVLSGRSWSGKDLFEGKQIKTASDRKSRTLVTLEHRHTESAIDNHRPTHTVHDALLSFIGEH